MLRCVKFDLSFCICTFFHVHDVYQICIYLSSFLFICYQADVYVNTSNTELDLSQGAVSRILAAAAGPILQAECSKKKPVKVGGIATTSGGQLQCQYVIHTVLPKYDGIGGRAEQVNF